MPCSLSQRKRSVSMTDVLHSQFLALARLHRGHIALFRHNYLCTLHQSNTSGASSYIITSTPKAILLKGVVDVILFEI